MKSGKTLAAMSSILLVLSATIATSGIAFATHNVKGVYEGGPETTTEILTGLVLNAKLEEVQKVHDTGQGTKSVRDVVVVTLTGKLTTEDGKGVAGKTIAIIDDSAYDAPPYDNPRIGSVVTDEKGSFEATWEPTQSRTYTVYAKFTVDLEFHSSASDKISVDAV